MMTAATINTTTPRPQCPPDCTAHNKPAGCGHLYAAAHGLDCERWTDGGETGDECQLQERE